MKNFIQILTIVILSAISLKAQTINTIAGGGFSGLGDGGLATSAQLTAPRGLAFDAAGNIFLADGNAERVRKIDVNTGIITTVAGNGTIGYNGDNIQATSAEINPWDVALDAAGNIYIADLQNNRIRKVDKVTGIITTIAGRTATMQGFPNGGYNGDGIPADSAKLWGPMGVTLDAAGNIYIADFYNNRIRKITASTGLISTVAGTGVNSYNGDGILATNAAVFGPAGLVLDGAGNIYIAENQDFRIRKVTASTGLISTIAGNGGTGFSGDGGLATAAQVAPSSIAQDASGNLYFANSGGRVRMIDMSTGIITTIAGTGVIGFSGDGGPAVNAQLSNLGGVKVDAAGNVYISDSGNNRLRKIGNNSVGIKTIDFNGTTSIYPNPISSSSVLYFNSEQKNLTITVTDVLGKVLRTDNFSGKEFVIEKGSLNEGIIF